MRQNPLIAFILILPILLGMSFVKNYQPPRDGRGRTPKDARGDLMTSWEGTKGISENISDRMKSEFSELGFKKDANINGLMRAFINQTKSRGKILRRADSDYLTLPYPDHILVVDLNTVSLKYREQLKEGSFDLNLMTNEIKREITGYSFVSEKGRWQWDGIRNLGGERAEILKSRDMKEFLKISGGKFNE